MPASRLPPLDTRIRFVVPENIEFEHRLAGPFSRLPAYLLDLAIRIAIMFAMLFVASFIGMAVGSFGAFGMVILLTWFAMEWFYGGFFETFWNGQTPGKRAFGLRVVSLDGRPITAMQAILRNLLRAVDQQPVLTFQVGLFTSACNRKYQRLGDLAAGTIVIVEQRQRMADVVQISDPAVQEALESLPTGFVVSRSLSRVLAKYVERRSYFGPARRQEIAGRLGSLLSDQLQLPPGTDHDALLCALYQKTFGTDSLTSGTFQPTSSGGRSPFAETAQP